MEIYISRFGQQFGPYTAQALRSFLAEGRVTDEDLAWTAGQTGWQPLRVLLGTIAETAGSPPNRAPALRGGDQPPPVSAPAVESEMTAERDSKTPVDLEPHQDTAVDLGSSTGAGPSASALPRGSGARRWLVGCAAWALALPAAIAVVGALIALTLIPKHVSIARSDSGFLRPDEGYTFVAPDDPLDWSVQWAPGTPSTSRPDTIADVEPDTWRPAPGYSRRSSDPTAPELVWVPGKREADFPHVMAGTEPGTWIPDPGYGWAGTATPTAPHVVWQQGVQLRHMTSAERENFWSFDPGYTFAADSTPEQPKAAWLPGSRHPQHIHVYASPQEGSWSVEAGYQWVNANDLRTFSPVRTWEAWHLAGRIDAGTHRADCPSADSILGMIESARDGYSAIDTSDVHPEFTRHLDEMRTTLNDGVTTINTCFVVDHAKDGADLLMGAACLFSDTSWQKCMDDSADAREVIGLVGKVGSIPCNQAVKSFGESLDQLTGERRHLQVDFEKQYGFQLAPPARILTCG